MSIAASVAEALSLLRAFCEICLAGAFLGGIFIVIESAFVLTFRGESTNGGERSAGPPITILKPLPAAEPGLKTRLAAFCRQNYAAPVQVLCGAQEDASAAAVVRGMERDAREATIELAVDSRNHGVNRKVSNLINMLPRARYDTLVLSDSDIVVGPDYLRGIAALLAAPGVGAVTCLYHGVAGAGVWARLSALAINAQFLPQAITGVGLRLAKPCCGATIALRRSMLERIGGFAAFADVLADDYAIGAAVRSAGYDVVTAPFLVGHCCFDDSLRQHLLHQIRVARTIRSIDPVGHAGSVLTHAWPLALLATLSGGTAAALLAIAVLGARVMLCRCVEWRFGLPRQDYWLIPVLDVVAFAAYVASFFGATVHWQGFDYRVAANGSLIEDNT
jgi:ceramide glucosyltransferase